MSKATTTLAPSFTWLMLPRMRSAWTMAPIPSTRTTVTTMKPQAPPCKERMAPRRIMTHPARLIFVALSGPPAAFDVVDVDGAGSAAALTATGFGSVSESFAAFALSSNPPMVNPRYKGVSRTVLSIQPLYESQGGFFRTTRQRPGADSRQASSSPSSSVLRKRRPATAPARAIMEMAGTTSKPGR